MHSTILQEAYTAANYFELLTNIDELVKAINEAGKHFSNQNIVALINKQQTNYNSKPTTTLACTF
jgi:hypothetical protein